MLILYLIKLPCLVVRSDLSSTNSNYQSTHWSSSATHQATLAFTIFRCSTASSAAATPPSQRTAWLQGLRSAFQTNLSIRLSPLLAGLFTQRLARIMCMRIDHFKPNSTPTFKSFSL